MQSPFLYSLLTWELLFFIVMNLVWVFLYHSFRKRKKSKFTKVKPLVSVIVPIFNKARYLRKTIDSALGLDYPKKEIILVNDGSSDESGEICQEYADKGLVKFINFKKNFGKAHAMNAGIKEARGELIMSVDADTVLNKNSLGLMVRHFEDKKIGAVAGVVKVKRKRGLLNRLQFIEYFHMTFQRLVQAFWHAVLVLPGPISLYRKSAIKEAGCFESDTLVEDWDMTLKIHKAGYKVASEKRAKSVTVAPEKVCQWWRQRIRWGRGGIKMIKKHRDIFHRSSNRALKGVMFPLHVLWVVIPFVVFPTLILVLLPSQIALANVWANILLFFAALKSYLFGGVGTISQLYQIIDKIIINFLDFGHNSMLKSFGYLSGVAFLWLTYTSIRVFERAFRPKHFLTLFLMPVYWLMLNIVSIYSVMAELLKTKSKW